MKFLPIVLFAAGLLPVAADYVVDVDLGTISTGATSISGTTAATVIDPGPPEVVIGGNNNSIFVKDLLNPAGNWGNEIVFRLELLQPSAISLTSISITGDPDFFLLDGLRTSVDTEFGTGKIAADDGRAFAYLDRFPPETEFLGAFLPGVYYLAAENFDGFDGGVFPGDSDFEVTMNVANAVAVDFPIDLGHIARSGSPFTLDTFGSDFNTELALYSSGGSVLVQNDDAGGGAQSELVFPVGLATGSYYAVIAGSDTTFGPSFSVSAGGETGVWNFSFPEGPTFGPGFESGVTDSSFRATESQFFFFTINPAPPNPVNLGTIADADEPFAIDTIGSNFDTQIGLYDSEGFLTAFNDDIDSDAGNFLSALEFDLGLPAGDYFLALAGYPNFFADGFEVFVDTFIADNSEGGNYAVNHPLGVSSGSLSVNSQRWFTFNIAATIAPSIDIVDLGFNSATNEFTVSWDSTLPGPFNIFVGTAAQLSALAPPPGNVLPTLAAAAVTSPATFTVPASLEGEPQLFLQVTD